MPGGLLVDPALDVGGLDGGTGPPLEPVDQALGLAQAPHVRRIVGCRLDRDVMRLAIATERSQLTPFAGDHRRLVPAPVGDLPG